MEEASRQIVIIGGGIIGCTAAYYLTRHPQYDPSRDSITILEASKLAGGASGKAGGLVARWAYPECLSLTSYKLHAELAKEHNGADKWGYRTIRCGSVLSRARERQSNDGSQANQTPTSGKSLQKLGKPSTKRETVKKNSRRKESNAPGDLDWVDPELMVEYEPMSRGGRAETAQVHPYQFTTCMARFAEEKGAKIIYGSAVSFDVSPEKRITGVVYQPKEGEPSQTLSASTVVLSAGPWTKTLLPAAPISTMRAHSICVRSSAPISPYALFGEVMSSNSRATQSLELYARPNDEVYICGQGDSLPLPATTEDVQVDVQKCDTLFAQAASISAILGEAEILDKQACYLPNMTVDGGPMVGKCRPQDVGMDGLILASGHTCWGICNSVATGKAVSEMIYDGKVTSMNLKSLEPRYFLGQ